ncbi:MAG: methyltransferase domain-containing protein [Armatimonadetes bacterium]|nr:methyltransferase domain-containing protein [Armatimonadota bacterium]
MDYRSYAELYEAEYADYREDIPFYVRKARRAGSPVLELGCGTGRVLIPVAAAGVEVWGLDLSPEMLARAAEKVGRLEPKVRRRITLREGDMTHFDLDRRFRLIYLPFREFMHLDTPEAQLAALESAHRHLEPDGRLLINYYDVDLEVLLHGTAGRDPVIYRHLHADFLDQETGLQVLVSTSSRYDPFTQRLTEERFYETVGEVGEVVDRRCIVLTQRWVFRWEMEHLLIRAGFRPVKVFGDYDGEPYREPGQDLTWEARPATARELEQERRLLEERLKRAR